MALPNTLSLIPKGSKWGAHRLLSALGHITRSICSASHHTVELELKQKQHCEPLEQRYVFIGVSSILPFVEAMYQQMHHLGSSSRGILFEPSLSQGFLCGIQVKGQLQALLFLPAPLTNVRVSSQWRRRSERIRYVELYRQGPSVFLRETCSMALEGHFQALGN